MGHGASRGDECFRSLMGAVASGDEAALRQFVEEFEPHIRRVARRMRRTRRSDRDSDDLVQEVWAAFFSRLAELPPLERPKALRDYLCAITRHKVVDWERREESVRPAPLPQTHPDGGLPPPLQAVQTEEWQRLHVVESPEEREVLRRWRMGQRARAIAAATGFHVRRVHRIFSTLIERVRSRPRKPR